MSGLVISLMFSKFGVGFFLFTEPVYGIKPFPTPDDSLYHFIPSKQYGAQHHNEQYD